MYVFNDLSKLWLMNKAVEYVDTMHEAGLNLFKDKDYAYSLGDKANAVLLAVYERFGDDGQKFFDDFIDDNIGPILSSYSERHGK